MQHRTMIVPEELVLNVRALADQFGPSSQNMWVTGVSPDGDLPVTHYVSAGFIGDEFADFLPCKSTTVDTEGNSTVTERPANYALFVELATLSGIDVIPQLVFNSIMQAVDVSDQEPFTALSRLGLQLVIEDTI